MSTSHSARDLAAELSRHAEAVCRTYLWNGKRQGHHLSVGDVGNNPGRSLYQPVDEVLVQSERRSKRIFTKIRAGMALRATRTTRMAASAVLSAVGSRISTHQPRATASLGVPAPINRRMSSPR